MPSKTARGWGWHSGWQGMAPGTVSGIVVDDESGGSFGPANHGLCLADAVAFFKCTGVDLSPYAGVEGSDTTYKLVLTDSASKVAEGVIGAADAAEALGGELVTNGTFNSDISGWNNHVVAYETFEYSAGTLHCVSDGSGVSLAGSDDNIAVTSGKLYKVSWDLSLSSGAVSVVNVRTTFGGGTTQVEWASPGSGTYTGYFTSKTSSNVVFGFYNQDAVAGDFTIDNVTVREVTHVGETGVHIVSAHDGAIRNWSSIESGFEYNDPTYTFEVQYC